METLKRTFLENPMIVYMVLGVALIVLAVLWHRRRTRRRAGLLLVPLVLAAGVYALATLVETDRERIQQATREIASEYQQGRLDAARRYLADDYKGFGNNKRLLLALGEETRKRFRIEKVHLGKMEITVTGPRAEMAVTTTLQYEAEGMKGATALRWTVFWAKRAEGWRIVKVEEPATTMPGF